MTLQVQLERKLNSPLTSSMGRLFDAAASLADVRQKVNYEAQAAIEFEALVDTQETGAYHFEIAQSEIQVLPAITGLIADVLVGVPASVISARFHHGLVNMIREVCSRIRVQTGLNEIALSGGVWQNMTLLTLSLAGLRQDGFKIYIHHQVPTNDGGLALGQALIAAHKMIG
jgi:hydrogenase maturation protein HypF